MRLANRTAVITGAGGDIGAAIARRFAREGARVLITDIDPDACRAVHDQIAAQGGQVSMVIADLTAEAQVRMLFQDVRTSLRPLDILVNICGGDAEAMTALEDLSVDGFTRNIDINLKSCLLCCREAGRIMMEQMRGTIVNMSSICYRGSPMQFTYAAAKGGVYALTRTLAMNLGPYNINVNALAPALVEVQALKNGMGSELWEAVRDDAASRYPMGRIAQPEDVAGCALFLASADAAFISGQIIEISGGARL